METCAIMSEAATGAKGNQIPFYLCSSLALANLHSSQTCISEHGFEISTSQAAQLRYRHESSCCFHHPELHESCFDLTAAATISNEQSTFMEMDNIHLPQYSASASGNHSSWPTTSPLDQFCQTFINEITPSKYPPSLGGARKRVDSNVQTLCTCEECRTSFLNRPETFPDQSTISNGKISEGTPLDLSDGSFMRTATRNDEPPILPKSSVLKLSAEDNVSKMDKSQCPENWVAFEPTEDVLRDATLFQASPQTVKGKQKCQLKAINVPHQDLIGDTENLASKQRKAKHVVTTTQERGTIFCTGHLTDTECGSLTNKVVRRSRRPRNKTDPEFSDHSSDNCIYRAARGCAVHPRSIAERVRRSDIAHRVKILETKLPDSIKRAGRRRLHTDEMLGRTIIYIKWLQNAIQMLLSHEMTPGDGTGSSATVYLPRNNEMEDSRFQ